MTLALDQFVISDFSRQMEGGLSHMTPKCVMLTYSEVFDSPHLSVVDGLVSAHREIGWMQM